MIEVGDLLAKDEVFEEGRATQARLQRVLIVCDRDTLVGREHRSVASTRTRSSEPTVGFWPMFGPPPPTLSDPFSSVTVLAPTMGSAGLTDAPCGGASAASGLYSAALFGLKGNAEATSCVPAAFSAPMSPSLKRLALPGRSRSCGYCARCSCL